MVLRFFFRFRCCIPFFQDQIISCALFRPTSARFDQVVARDFFSPLAALSSFFPRGLMPLQIVFLPLFFLVRGISSPLISLTPRARRSFLECELLQSFLLRSFACVTACQDFSPLEWPPTRSPSPHPNVVGVSIFPHFPELSLFFFVQRTLGRTSQKPSSLPATHHSEFPGRFVRLPSRCPSTALPPHDAADKSSPAASVSPLLVSRPLHSDSNRFLEVFSPWSCRTGIPPSFLLVPTGFRAAKFSFLLRLFALVSVLYGILRITPVH